jgi:hypothetical protein
MWSGAIGREYRAAASAADQWYYGTEDSPVSQRLATLTLTGLAFGRFREIFDTVHILVARRSRGWRSRAWPGGGARWRRHQDRKAAWMATVSAVQSSAMQCR